MFSKPAPVISADVDVQEETANDETKWSLIDFVSNEVRRRSIPNVLTATWPNSLCKTDGRLSTQCLSIIG